MSIVFLYIVFHNNNKLVLTESQAEFIMFEAWAQQRGHYLHSRTTLYIDKELRFAYARRD